MASNNIAPYVPTRREHWSWDEAAAAANRRDLAANRRVAKRQAKTAGAFASLTEGDGASVTQRNANGAPTRRVKANEVFAALLN